MSGDLVCHTSHNYNPLCAMAADLVIAEVEGGGPSGRVAP